MLIFLSMFFGLISLFSTNFIYSNSTPGLNSLGGGDFTGVSDDKNLKIILVIFLLSLIFVFLSKSKKSLYSPNFPKSIFNDLISIFWIRSIILFSFGMLIKIIVIFTIDQYQLDPGVQKQWDSINLYSWKIFLGYGLDWGVDFWYPYGNLINFYRNGFTLFLLSVSPVLAAFFMIQIYRILGGIKFYIEFFFILLSILVIGEIYFVRYLLIPLSLLYIYLKFTEFTKGKLKFITLWLTFVCITFSLTDTFYISFLIFTFFYMIRIFVSREYLTNFIFYFLGILPLFIWLFSTNRLKFVYHFIFSSFDYHKGPYNQFNEFNYLKSNLDVILLMLLAFLIYFFTIKSSISYLFNSNKTNLNHFYYLFFVSGIFSYALFKVISRFDGGYDIVYLTSLLMLPIVSVWIEQSSSLKSTYIFTFVIFMLTLSLLGSLYKARSSLNLTEKNNISSFSSQDLNELYLRDMTDIILNDKILSKISNIVGKSSIFVLTDYPLLLHTLYAVNPETSPWVNNIFNMSNSYDKVKILSDLQENPPEYVIFEQDQQIFDGIPNSIRIPEIYSFISQNYLAQFDFENIVILQLNPKMASINKSSSFFGTAIDFGYTQTLLNKKNMRCYVEIHSSVDTKDSVESISISIRNQIFKIMYVKKSQTNTTFLDLDKSWLKFWLTEKDCQKKYLANAN